MNELNEYLKLFREENQDLIEVYDQIIEQDEDFFFYRKKSYAIENHGASQLQITN